MRDLLVRAQELGGRWVSLGSDAARGIVVQGFSCDVDTWGPRSCTFALRRKTDVPWPDIGALAPLEVFDQGVLIWSGRVKGTPTSDGSDRSITVNGEGWAYHLDDDVYQRNYVHTRLTDFVDARSLLTCPLANFPVGGVVSVGDGAISLGFQIGVTYPANTYIGVTLDFGPTLCANVAVNWLSSFNTSDIVFFCRGNGTPDGGIAGDDAFTFPLNAAPASFNAGNFAAPQRYVNLFIYWAAGGSVGAECWVKIIPPTNLFGDVAFASGGYSVLKASTVVADAKERATMLLSDDDSKIQTTSFVLPEFSMSGPSTPREAITAANAFQNWQPRVNADRLLEFRPLPAVPAIQVDQRATFDEASSGDSSEIYSGALVTYTDAAGVSENVMRSQQAHVYAPSVIQPTNPGAEVNTTGWAATGTGTLSRTTTAGEFSAGVAAFKSAVGANLLFGMTTSAWTGGPFIPGTAHRLTFDFRADGYTVPTVSIDGVVVGRTVYLGSLSGLFESLTLDWVQTSASDPVLYFGTTLSTGTASAVYVDNLLLNEGAPTIINRRGFRRTKIIDTSMALTEAGAGQIGDVYLEGHRTTPLKGQLVVTGYGTASIARSGQRMATSELLLYGGDLVRLMHLVDPDTGALGREGRIATASWDSESDTTTIEIDAQSQNFEAMLSRLALVTGQVA